MQPDFQSDLTYSVQNEDYRTELAVIRRIYRGSPLRVLMVASSGENALSLMTDDKVGDVHAADINAAQVHLAELRRTALRYLSRDEQLKLLGAEPADLGPAGASARLALYDRVADHLPRATRAFWNERREREVAFGIQHVGRHDVVMADIRANLRKHGFLPLEKPLNGNELPASQAAYAEVLTAEYIREKLGLPAAIAERLASLAPRMAELHFRALVRRDARINYFVTTALEGRYADTAGEEGLPLYLQYDGQEALRRLGSRDRLKLHVGNIFDHAKTLAAKSGAFDLISVSNIVDWMDEAEVPRVVSDLQSCLNPGGALVVRTVRDSGMIAQVMARHLAVDESFNAALSEIERGPWFRAISASFHNMPNACGDAQG